MKKNVLCQSFVSVQRAVRRVPIYLSPIAKGVYNIFCVLCQYCFFLVRGRQSAFSPHRGYSLHRDTILVQNMSSSNEQLSRSEHDRHWRAINQTWRSFMRGHLTECTLSLSLSLRYNGHFPGGPWLASTRMSPFGILLELRMTGGDWHYSCKTCRAPVKSSPPTNQHPTFYRPDILHVTQPTVSKHWSEKSK